MNKSPANFINIIGQKFNKLTVISRAPDKQKWKPIYNCLCDCGNKVIVYNYNLKNNHTTSCGCHQKRVASKKNRTHYLTGSTEYRTWANMKNRCYNTRSKRFNDWGGRGIKVCDRWIDSFENFLEDMGKKPTPQHSIDRIDNNGNYTPSNCKWSTTIEQSNNKNNNVVLEYKGRKLTISEWSRVTKITDKVLYSRISKGWNVEKTLTTPIKKYNYIS